MFWDFLKKEKKINEIVDLRMAEIMVKVDMDFKFLQSMQRLDIKDGDIIALRYPGVLSETAHERLKTTFQKVIKDFGYDVKILVLEEGLEIETLRKDEQTGPIIDDIDHEKLIKETE